MSNDTQNDSDESDITVSRKREIVQRESLKVESQRGTGTNDRDKVKKFVEREAELDVPENMLESVPSLIGEQAEGQAIGDVANAMNEIRDSNRPEE